MSERTEIVKREESMPERGRQIPVIGPLVDIYENDNEIFLYADMPGVVKEEIAINIDNGKLALAGVRRLDTAGAANQQEFGDLEYRRTFSVPQSIDLTKVAAELKDGVLKLHLPRAEAARPRNIEIKSA